MAKIQLIQKLIDDGFFDTVREAEAYLMAGQILVDGTKVTKNVKVPGDCTVTVVSPPYSGKGGLKLEHALKALDVSVEDKVCVDAGASTGGFTDCLLKKGARLVYAVDVGYGQLAGSLRQDRRVVNLERTNISKPELTALDPRPEVGSIDVSYLSLKKAVPYFRAILHDEGDLVCLVKPLFEIDDPVARRTGIIAPDAYRPILKDLGAHFQSDGACCGGITYSPVTGNKGTIEFFMRLRLGGGSVMPEDEMDREITLAVEQALALDPYRKGQEGMNVRI